MKRRVRNGSHSSTQNTSAHHTHARTHTASHPHTPPHTHTHRLTPHLISRVQDRLPYNPFPALTARLAVEAQRLNARRHTDSAIESMLDGSVYRPPPQWQQ